MADLPGVRAIDKPLLESVTKVMGIGFIGSDENEIGPNPTMVDILAQSMLAEGLNQPAYTADPPHGFVSIPFGGHFASATAVNVFNSVGPDINNSDPRATAVFVREFFGAVEDTGPQDTNAAAFFFCVKRDWKNTTEPGQADAYYAAVANGIIGESGSSFGAYKRDGRTTGGANSVLGIEYSVSWQGPGTFADLADDSDWEVHVVIGYGEGPGSAGQSFGQGDGMGILVEGRAGLIRALYVGAIDGPTAATATADYYLSMGGTRNIGTHDFQVAPGPIVYFGPPSDRSSLRPDLTGNTLRHVDFDGTTILFESFRTTGHFNVLGGLRVGGAGSRLTFVSTGSDTFDYGTLAAGAIHAAHDVTVTGAAVGDHVEITPLTWADVRISFDAHVQSANTVRVYAKNPTSAAMSAGSTIIAIRCSRYV